MKLLSDDELPPGPPEPVTPWRATCNRLVLDAAARDYDRRHGRTSRRQSSRTPKAQPQRQEASAAA